MLTARSCVQVLPYHTSECKHCYRLAVSTTVASNRDASNLQNLVPAISSGASTRPEDKTFNRQRELSDSPQGQDKCGEDLLRLGRSHQIRTIEIGVDYIPEFFTDQISFLADNPYWEFFTGQLLHKLQWFHLDDTRKADSPRDDGSSNTHRVLSTNGDLDDFRVYRINDFRCITFFCSMIIVFSSISPKWVGIRWAFIIYGLPVCAISMTAHVVEMLSAVSQEKISFVDERSLFLWEGPSKFRLRLLG